jgi:wyosine [tRNA(Phe)-imidazoG37] synthetase (radical SAM superfamily)
MEMKSEKNLYSNLKFIDFPKQLLAVAGEEWAPPGHIRIKPINACNHDCWYCAYHVDWLKLGDIMEYKDVLPKDKMFEIIEDIIEMKVRAVTFSGGGEPLMYPHIKECVEKLSKGGVKVAALTNGSNLKGKVADVFAEHATWVRISIDAWDGPSYAKARNVKEDEFEKVIQNIREFSQRKSSCVIGISFIIEEKNSSHVFDFISLMKEIGVNHVSASGCVVSNSGKENNEYHKNIKDTVVDQMNQASSLVDESFHLINNFHDLDERFDKTYDSCPFINFQTVIGANAVVYACHDKAYTEEGALGSIKDQRFKDFWFSEENKAAMKAINPSIHCKHHCVADKRNHMILDYVNLDRSHIDFV